MGELAGRSSAGSCELGRGRDTPAVRAGRNQQEGCNLVMLARLKQAKAWLKEGLLFSVSRCIPSFACAILLACVINLFCCLAPYRSPVEGVIYKRVIFQASSLHGEGDPKEIISWPSRVAAWALGGSCSWACDTGAVSRAFALGIGWPL